MSKTYKLIPVTELDKSVQLQLLNIRNEEHIRQWMFTGKIISVDEHLSWIKHLKTDLDQICFVIIDDDGCPYGSVNLKKINKNHKTAELGFYKTETLNEKGLVTRCLKALIDYSFDVIGLEKLYSEVFEGNVKSVNIHEKLFFCKEGFLRSHIIKKENRIGIYLFGLLKHEWRNQKNNIVNDVIQIQEKTLCDIGGRIINDV